MIDDKRDDEIDGKLDHTPDDKMVTRYMTPSGWQ